MIIKAKPAIHERYLSLTRPDINAPAVTPRADAKMSAIEDAINTVSFGFFESTAYRKVASCVLSPSSAINIVEKTIMKSRISISHLIYMFL